MKGQISFRNTSMNNNRVLKTDNYIIYLLYDIKLRQKQFFLPVEILRELFKSAYLRARWWQHPLNEDTVMVNPSNAFKFSDKRILYVQRE